MTDQIVTWTALPTSIIGTAPNSMLQLSVFISPRLHADAEATLGAFPDFLDWPSRVQPAATSFQVRVASAPTAAPLLTVAATIVSSPPDSTLWKDLFTQASPVQSHVFADSDYSSRPIVSYPATKIKSYLKQGHQTLSTQSPVALPTAGAIRTAYPELHFLFNPTVATSPVPGVAPTFSAGDQHLAQSLFQVPDLVTLNQYVGGLLTTAGQQAQSRRAQFATTAIPPDAGQTIPVVSTTGITNPDQDSVFHFSQFKVFHHRDSGSQPVAQPNPADYQHLVDFHQMLSSLGDYPGIMRVLGLVIDLQIPAAGFPSSTADAPLLLQVVPTWQPQLAATTSYCPWTAYVLDGDHFFLPAARPPTGGAIPETVFGLLNLADPSYEVLQMDVDGAAFKALHMARTQASETSAGSGADDASGPPSLRTAGMFLMRDGRAHVLNATFNTNHNNNVLLESTPPQLATFFADDLTRGYRFDVWDAASQRWRSLHQRVGTYTFLNHPGGAYQVSFPDEGCVQPAVTEPAAAGGAAAPPTSPVYIHESLFRWEGWSLSAPRPGKSLSSSPQAPTPNDPRTQPQVVPNTAVTAFPLTTSFTVQPGSLPRLRLGHDYQFRARLVDLAGNSLRVDDADALLKLLPDLNLPLPVQPPTPATYRRSEPVNAPVLVARQPFTEGESLERLVIRSNANVSADGYAQAHPPYLGSNDRHVAPPKTWQLMAETAGLLDASFGSGSNFQQTYNIARKEHGSLTDSTIIDITTGNTVPVPGVVLVTIEQATPPPDPQSYALHQEAQLQLPYLPDPMSRAATLCNLPGVPAGEVGLLDSGGNLVFQPSSLPAQFLNQVGSLTQIPFGPSSDWPLMLPFRLNLVEGADAPSWDSAARVLTVALPKAEQAVITLSSSGLLDADLHVQEIWQWILEQGQQSNQPDVTILLELAKLGVLWSLTPMRQIALVHAVQQPLLAPQFLVQGTESFSAVKTSAGMTFAYLGGRLQIHGKSTAKLDLVATWTDQVDRPGDPAFPAPQAVTSSAHIFEIPIHLPGEAGAGGTAGPSVSAITPDNGPTAGGTSVTIAGSGLTGATAVGFGATGASTVSVDSDTQITAVSPPGSGTVDVTVTTPAGTSATSAADQFTYADPGIVPIALYDAIHDVVELQAPAPGDQSGRTFLSRQEFGDTKYRNVTYQVIATTRFRDYFSGAITSDPEQVSVRGAALVVNVPSSARPAAPRVSYAVPTFAWDRPPVTTPPQARTITRRGGGIRVYLERPWFSSGDGELLAVVLTYPTMYPPNERMRSFVTHWGNDPLWATDPLPGAPPTFPGADQYAEKLTLEELMLPDGTWADNELVHVAAYMVQFDASRDLWYADIQVDAGSTYFPFLRLALARFQPQSIPGLGLELSRVVLSDFIQVTPDRSITVTPVTNSADQYTLEITGVTYQSNSWQPNDAVDREVTPDPVAVVRPNLIEVSVEQRVPGTSDEAGWLPADMSQAIAVQITGAALAGSPSANPQQLWSGQVTLPSGRAQGEFRVVVREFEHIGDDRSFSQTGFREYVPDLPHGPGWVPTTVTFFPGVGRLVFAETILL